MEGKQSKAKQRPGGKGTLKLKTTFTQDTEQEAAREKITQSNHEPFTQEEARKAKRGTRHIEG